MRSFALQHLRIPTLTLDSESASEIAQKDKIKDALEGIGKSKIDARESEHFSL